MLVNAKEQKVKIAIVLLVLTLGIGLWIIGSYVVKEIRDIQNEASSSYLDYTIEARGVFGRNKTESTVNLEELNTILRNVQLENGGCENIATEIDEKLIGELVTDSSYYINITNPKLDFSYLPYEEEPSYFPTVSTNEIMLFGKNKHDIELIAYDPWVNGYNCFKFTKQDTNEEVYKLLFNEYPAETSKTESVTIYHDIILRYDTTSCSLDERIEKERAFTFNCGTRDMIADVKVIIDPEITGGGTGFDAMQMSMGSWPEMSQEFESPDMQADAIDKKLSELTTVDEDQLWGEEVNVRRFEYADNKSYFLEVTIEFEAEFWKKQGLELPGIIGYQIVVEDKTKVSKEEVLEKEMILIDILDSHKL